MKSYESGTTKNRIKRSNSDPFGYFSKDIEEEKVQFNKPPKTSALAVVRKFKNNPSLKVEKRNTDDSVGVLISLGVEIKLTYKRRRWRGTWSIWLGYVSNRWLEVQIAPIVIETQHLEISDWSWGEFRYKRVRGGRSTIRWQWMIDYK